MWRKFLVLSLLAWAALAAAAAEIEAAAPVIPAQPTVVASIKPVGWLVAELAPRQIYQQTIVPNGYSPHEYQLRPQDAATIKAADVLIWIGPAMEPWLVPYASKLERERQLALLPQLHDRGHQHQHANHEHDHDHGHHHDDAAESVLAQDPHLWLDPQQMRTAAVAVAATLTARYPQHQREIETNLAHFSARLQALDNELASDFKAVAHVGFAVYHDAYSHLVARYQLNQVAAVWHHEAVPPGAKARAILMQQLAAGDAVCLFYEPEHGADQVDKWLGKNSLRYTEIDLLGQAATDGVGGYETFMRALSAQMIDCLRRGKTN